MSLILESSAFVHATAIPSAYTCQGDDISPPLTWSKVPAETKSLVLIVDDPDAPDPNAPKMTWVHWLLYNIQPDTVGLAKHMSTTTLPPGTKEGLNDWQELGYRGPCPRYFFKLFALDCVLDNLKSPTKKKLEAAIEGHVIEQVELMGTYEKE